MLAEVDEVLQGRAATLADLPRLGYTLQVLKESMRIYPPVYMFNREPTEETTVQGYRLPKCANVLFSPYLLHHRAGGGREGGRVDGQRWPDQPVGQPAAAGRLVGVDVASGAAEAEQFGDRVAVAIGVLADFQLGQVEAEQADAPDQVLQRAGRDPLAAVA